jgi:hypothetical protein
MLIALLSVLTMGIVGLLATGLALVAMARYYLTWKFGPQHHIQAD